MESLDEFDYFVSFPNLNARRPSTDDQKDPVVFLFGWAGCEDKYLAKYSSIWEMEGCITVRYTAPRAYIFWKRDEAMPIVGQKVLGLIEELDLTGHPIIFHVFSGGGCMVLNAMFGALESESSKYGSDNLWDRIIGIVFDSCPAKASYFQRALAYYGGPQRNNSLVAYLQNQATIWISIFVFFLWDLTNYFRNFFYQPHRHYFDELLRHKLPSNQLFLYSSADSICSYEHIEEFLDLEGAKELNRVLKIRWSDSPHCQHLRHHPEEYRTAISEFVARTFDEQVEQGFERLEKPKNEETGH